MQQFYKISIFMMIRINCNILRQQHCIYNKGKVQEPQGNDRRGWCSLYSLSRTGFNTGIESRYVTYVSLRHDIAHAGFFHLIKSEIVEVGADGNTKYIQNENLFSLSSPTNLHLFQYISLYVQLLTIRLHSFRNVLVHRTMMTSLAHYEAYYHGMKMTTLKMVEQ